MYIDRYFLFLEKLKENIQKAKQEIKEKEDALRK
jgi:hypothetical protein